jgi:amidase
MAQASVGGANGSVGRAAMRIPSSFCGTVGHKPTHGLVPYTGAFPIENTIDHLGPITRNVHDAALLLTVLAGRDGLDPRQRAEHLPSDFLTGLEAGAAGLRVAVVAEGFGIPGLSQPGVDETVRAAIRTLEAAGAAVSEVSLPWHRDGLHVWNVIATDGATNQMIDGNAYGMNSPAATTPN